MISTTELRSIFPWRILYKWRIILQDGLYSTYEIFFIPNCKIEVAQDQNASTPARNFRWSEIAMKSDRDWRQGRGSSSRSSSPLRRPPSIARYLVDDFASRDTTRSPSIATPVDRLSRECEHARMPCNLHPMVPWQRDIFLSSVQHTGRQ